jgi:acyl-CoA hydrolase
MLQLVDIIRACDDIMHYKKGVNIMSKKGPEMKDKLTETRWGKDVDYETFKFMFGQEDSHYPGSLISGSKILEKNIDFATAFLARREGGKSNLLVHADGNILHPCGVCDVLEVVCRIVKEGNTSRVVAFEMYKLQEYDKKKDFYKPCEDPMLVAKGECTCVLGAWEHS